MTLVKSQGVPIRQCASSSNFLYWCPLSIFTFTYLSLSADRCSCGKPRTCKSSWITVPVITQLKRIGLCQWMPLPVLQPTPGRQVSVSTRFFYEEKCHIASQSVFSIWEPEQLPSDKLYRCIGCPINIACSFLGWLRTIIEDAVY